MSVDIETGEQAFTESHLQHNFLRGPLYRSLSRLLLPKKEGGVTLPESLLATAHRPVRTIFMMLKNRTYYKIAEVV
jgi:hypothetical protein